MRWPTLSFSHYNVSHLPGTPHGIESMESLALTLEATDMVVAYIFVVEVALRLLGSPAHFVRSPWDIFDAIIVVRRDHAPRSISASCTYDGGPFLSYRCSTRPSGSSTVGARARACCGCYDSTGSR